LSDLCLPNFKFTPFSSHHSSGDFSPFLVLWE
jgi:hypothetical protein